MLTPLWIAAFITAVAGILVGLVLERLSILELVAILFSVTIVSSVVHIGRIALDRQNCLAHSDATVGITLVITWLAIMTMMPQRNLVFMLMVAIPIAYLLHAVTAQAVDRLMRETGTSSRTT